MARELTARACLFFRTHQCKEEYGVAVVKFDYPDDVVTVIDMNGIIVSQEPWQIHFLPEKGSFTFKEPHDDSQSRLSSDA